MSWYCTINAANPLCYTVNFSRTEDTTLLWWFFCDSNIEASENPHPLCKFDFWCYILRKHDDTTYFRLLSNIRKIVDVNSALYSYFDTERTFFIFRQSSNEKHSTYINNCPEVAVQEQTIYRIVVRLEIMIIPSWISNLIYLT